MPCFPSKDLRTLKENSRREKMVKCEGEADEFDAFFLRK